MGTVTNSLRLEAQPWQSVGLGDVDLSLGWGRFGGRGSCGLVGGLRRCRWRRRATSAATLATAAPAEPAKACIGCSVATGALSGCFCLFQFLFTGGSLRRQF